MSSQNLSQEQFAHLPKELSAKELSGITLEDHDDLMGRFDFAEGDDQKLLDYKYKNAKKRGLLDDVLKNGIKEPLEVHVDKYGDQTLTEGHHRLAIAMKHFPDTKLPIQYWTG